MQNGLLDHRIGEAVWIGHKFDLKNSMHSLTMTWTQEEDRGFDILCGCLSQTPQLDPEGDICSGCWNFSHS